MMKFTIACFMCILFCSSICKAVDFSQATEKDENGNPLKLLDVSIDASDIVYVNSPDGEKVQMQLTRQDKGYVVVQKNDTCLVTLNEAEPTECQETVKPTEAISDEIKNDCGDVEEHNILYVKPIECPAEGDIQKRAACRYYYYYRYRCYYFIRGRRWYRYCRWYIIRLRRCFW